MYSEEQIKHFI